MTQRAEYWKEYRKRPDVAEKNRVYQRAWRRARYDNDPVYAAVERERARAHYRSLTKSPERWAILACRTTKRRAYEDGVAFDIAPADVLPPLTCPVFGIPFVFHTQNHPFNPSVDRIVGQLGYTKGNVRVISRRANVIKSDCTSSAEVLAVALYMEREGL